MFQKAGQLLMLVGVSVHLAMLSTASIVTLTKDPPTIKPFLTKHLLVRCDLNDTQAGTGLVGKRDGVVQTSTNIKQLISLVVLKNGGEIATITPFTSASIVGDQGSLNVTGAITDTTGFLQLTWSYPGEEESGNVTCEANGINGLGHNTKYMTSVVVGVVEPSLSDLAKRVHDQELRQIQLMEENQNQSTNIDRLTAQTQNQSSKIVELSTQNRDMSSKLTQQAGLLSAQAKEISEQRQQMSLQNQRISVLGNATCHIEVGGINCGDSSTWTKSVTFKDKYGAPPNVLVSVKAMDHYDNTDYNIPDYFLQADSVSETGFTLNCWMWGVPSDNHYRWRYFTVQWAAFPQYRPA